MHFKSGRRKKVINICQHISGDEKFLHSQVVALWGGALGCTALLKKRILLKFEIA